MIMKGCVQWNSVYGWDFISSEDRTRSARSVGQHLTQASYQGSFERRNNLFKEKHIVYYNRVACIVIDICAIKYYCVSNEKGAIHCV